MREGKRERQREREKRLEYKTVKVRESDDIIKQGSKQRSFARRVAAAQHPTRFNSSFSAAADYRRRAGTCLYGRETGVLTEFASI